MVERLEQGRWTIPALFLLALTLRITIMVAWPVMPQSDGEFYMLRAAEIASGLGYQEAGHPTAFWPIGYPAAAAGAMLLFGPGLLGPMVLNLIAAALIMAAIVWFGRHVACSEPAARLALLLYAIYPAHIFYTGAPLSEPLSTALTMTAFALLIGGRRDWRLLLLCGLLFGAATLMRPQTLLFPAGAIIALLLVYRDFDRRSAIVAWLAVYLALFATVLPWSLRNQAELGAFVLVSTNGGVALWTGANDHATGDHMAVERTPLWSLTGVAWEQRVERQVELDQRERALAIGWISENPLRWLALGPRKVILLWRKDSDAFWPLQGSYPERATLWTALQWLNQAFYLLLLGLAAACFIAAGRALLRRDMRYAPLALLACMPMFVSLLAFAFTGQIRYHYPAMPFLVIAAGWTIAQLAARRGAERLPRLARSTR